MTLVGLISCFYEWNVKFCHQINSRLLFRTYFDVVGSGFDVGTFVVLRVVLFLQQSVVNLFRN